MAILKFVNCGKFSFTPTIAVSKNTFAVKIVSW